MQFLQWLLPSRGHFKTVSDQAGDLAGFSRLVKTLKSSGEEGTSQCFIPGEWCQGRTAYGGLTAGLSLEVARTAFPQLPPLRSATINFIGPVGPEPVFIPKLLRKGKNVTSIQVEVYTDEKMVGSSVFIFGAARESHINVALDGPEAASPDEVEDFVPEQFLSMLPVFFQNFQTQLIEGARPLSGSDEGYIRAWSRHKDVMSRQGEASFLALADVLPPAAMPMFKKIGPVSSVNWMLNIINEPITQDGWYQIESRQAAANNGYSSQGMRFWNRDGTLIADGMQCVAIFI